MTLSRAYAICIACCASAAIAITVLLFVVAAQRARTPEPAPVTTPAEPPPPEGIDPEVWREFLRTGVPPSFGPVTDELTPEEKRQAWEDLQEYRRAAGLPPLTESQRPK